MTHSKLSISPDSDDKVQSQMTVFSLFLARKMPWLFVVWLVLAVLGPHQELYKIFFHAIVIPAILILLINKETHIDWSDPLLKVALLYFVYGAVTTFIVGSGPIENHFRALRWCLEIVFCLLAFFIWMPALLRRPLWWGRLLVLLAGLSSLFASALFFVEGNLLGRLSGPGGLHNPIQTGAVLLVFLAVG